MEPFLKKKYGKPPRNVSGGKTRNTESTLKVLYVEIIFYFIDYSTMWELRLLLVVLGAVLLFPEAEIFRSENLFLAWELLLSTPIFVLFFDKTGLFDQRPAHHSIFSQFL